MSCSVNFTGVTVTVNATVNLTVSGVTTVVTMHPVVGVGTDAFSLDQRGSWSLYFGQESQGPAIDFARGADAAKYEWVQVVNSTAAGRSSATASQSRNGAALLDLVDPNDQEVNDSPAETLDYAWPYLSRSDTFSTYLMYRPSDFDVWVPLQRIDWWWSGNATYNSNHQHLEWWWFLDNEHHGSSHHFVPVVVRQRQGFTMEMNTEVEKMSASLPGPLRRLFPFTSCCALLVTCAGLGPCQSQPQKAEPAAAAMGPAASNAILEMTIKAYPPREEKIWTARIMIVLKNVSDHPVTIWGGSPEWEYEIEVTDAYGNPVPRTERGERLPKSDEERKRNPFGGHASITEPGDEHTDRVDLAESFEMHRGGTYLVKVRRSHGLPVADNAGRPLTPQVLTQSFEIRLLK